MKLVECSLVICLETPILKTESTIKFYFFIFLLNIASICLQVCYFKGFLMIVLNDITLIVILALIYHPFHCLLMLVI